MIDDTLNNYDLLDDFIYASINQKPYGEKRILIIHGKPSKDIIHTINNVDNSHILDYVMNEHDLFPGEKYFIPNELTKEMSTTKTILIIENNENKFNESITDFLKSFVSGDVFSNKHENYIPNNNVIVITNNVRLFVRGSMKKYCHYIDARLCSKYINKYKPHMH
jgi:hypothetical protein